MGNDERSIFSRARDKSHIGTATSNNRRIIYRGKGDLSRDPGIGLRSIRLRAEYIRAMLKIESDDKGTLVILEVPYDNN